jgi:hypothetical protein
MFEVSFGIYCLTGDRVESTYSFSQYKDAVGFLHSTFEVVQNQNKMVFLYGEIKQKTQYGLYVLAEYQYFNNGKFAFVEHSGPYIQESILKT